jgi:2-(1,2-epoxy-1,2-dihydrophenyl)acetyl-CoA isomerase
MSDVLFDRKDNGVALITLNRPESMNAMGGQLMPMLAQYLADCANDDAVRCVVLTGAGRAFCAGGDVKGMASGRAVLGEGTERERSPAADFARGTEILRQSQRATSYVLHTMPKPTIAMINGAAVGAGLSLALACDVRIASENAKLGTAFRNVGFSGDFGGSWFLPRLVGMERARDLYFSGAILSAEEAKHIGMVSRVVPHDNLEKETMEYAGHLAAGPTLAYARMKENLNRTWANDLLTHLDQEALNMRLSGQTQDHREAAKAFVEKRTPVFTGE